MDKKYKNVKGIYKLTIESHIYIGSSVNLYKRICSHFNYLRKKNHDNEYLQHCVDKYGINNLKWEIVEVEDNNIKYIDLLKREKYFIEYFHADLNLKLDPVTQTNCITTSKSVCQFNQFGELIREWPSISEAARSLNIDSSNILIACTNRSRQRLAANFLWDYSRTYTGELKIIYVFNLNGDFMGRYKDTIDLYSDLFPDKKRKTVLSQLKKKIDSGIPYENIYLSSTKDFKINPNYKPHYRELNDFDKILLTNPIIYHFDKNNNLIEAKRFKEYNHPSYIKKSLLKDRHSHCYYSLSSIPSNSKCTHQRCVAIIATKIENNESFRFNSLKDCAKELFNEKDGKAVGKHLKRNTPYKGYLFKRDN